MSVVRHVRHGYRTRAKRRALARLLAALLALCSCASFDNAPRDTTVRRFDSMSSLALGCDELGAEGWRVASVVELDDGAAFVVVLQRRAVTR